jgi:hypothetical protein
MLAGYGGVPPCKKGQPRDPKNLGFRLALSPAHRLENKPLLNGWNPAPHRALCAARAKRSRAACAGSRMEFRAKVQAEPAPQTRGVLRSFFVGEAKLISSHKPAMPGQAGDLPARRP